MACFFEILISSILKNLISSHTAQKETICESESSKSSPETATMKQVVSNIPKSKVNLSSSKAKDMSKKAKPNICPQTSGQPSYSDATKTNSKLAPKNNDHEVENSYKSHKNKSELHKEKNTALVTIILT